MTSCVIKSLTHSHCPFFLSFSFCLSFSLCLFVLRLHGVVPQPGCHLTLARLQPEGAGRIRGEHRLRPGPVGVHRGRPRPQPGEGGLPGPGPRVAPFPRHQRGPQRAHPALPPRDAELQRGHVNAPNPRTHARLQVPPLPVSLSFSLSLALSSSSSFIPPLSHNSQLRPTLTPCPVLDGIPFTFIQSCFL